MNPRLKFFFLFCMTVFAVLYMSAKAGPAAGLFAGVACASATVHLMNPNAYALGALIQLSDRFVPAVYATMTAIADVERTAFVQSGVAVHNPEFDARARSGSKTVETPYWNLFAMTTAPNLSNDSETVATPNKLTQGSYNSRMCFYNQGWKAADLARELGAGDPMQQIKNTIEAYWAHQFQYLCLAIAKGIYAKNVATNSGDMVYNVAVESIAGQSAATKVSRDAVTGALATFGDAFGQTGVIAMHSTVYFRLVGQDQIDFDKPSGTTEEIPYYMGKRVVVDDGMPVVAGTTDGYKYTTAIYGSGAFNYGNGAPLKPEELERQAAQGNGAGVETLWSRREWLVHPQGHNMVSGSVAGFSPTFAEWALAANWARVQPRKAVPIAFLVTNG